MIELRFHRELYRGESVDEAVKAFGGVAQFQLVEEPSHWVVRVTADEDEAQIAHELSNWALGSTLRNRSTK